MKNIFDWIYLVGHGAPARMCADILLKFNLPFTFLNCSERNDLFSQKKLGKSGVEQKPLATHIDALFNESRRSLVLSVNNTFLFPARLLKKNNITIINYHNSMLPHFRGMHAEAWAIFTGCSETGITWHLVDENIDTGGILFQVPIEITDSITSIGLLQAQASLAMDCLKKNLDKILAGDLQPLQNKKERGSIYYKKDRPGNGILDPDWPTDKIWRFLRAMDYGPYYNLGLPIIRIGAKNYSWQKYRRKTDMEKAETISFKDNKIEINNSIYLEDAHEVV